MMAMMMLMVMAVMMLMVMVLVMTAFICPSCAANATVPMLLDLRSNTAW